MSENVNLGDASTPEVKMQISADQVPLAEAALQALLGDDDQFHKLTEGELFGFSLALAALRRGHSVARASWRIPGKYVMLQPGEEMIDPESGEPAVLKEHLLWKNAEGKFVPWAPSQDAVLAKDWFIGRSGEAPRKDPTALVEILTFDNDPSSETSHGVVAVPARYLEGASNGGQSVHYNDDTVSARLGRQSGLWMYVHRADQ